MNQLEIALKAENEKLLHKIQLMQSISTRDKFHAYFFKICNNYTTRKDAFEYLNTLYAEHFGNEMFVSYASFRKYYERKTLKK